MSLIVCLSVSGVGHCLSDNLVKGVVGDWKICLVNIEVEQAPPQTWTVISHRPFPYRDIIYDKSEFFRSNLFLVSPQLNPDRESIRWLKATTALKAKASAMKAEGMTTKAAAFERRIERFGISQRYMRQPLWKKQRRPLEQHSLRTFQRIHWALRTSCSCQTQFILS